MERVGFFQRLNTRVVLLQGAILFVVLFVASWRFQSHQMAEARRTLDAIGSSLVPLMTPPLRAALDLAYDETNGTVDTDLLQTYIVENLFGVARTNQDLAYADLILPQGTSVATYRDPLVPARVINGAFANFKAGEDGGRATATLVVRQAALLTPDGQRRLGTLRLAFSLARIEERASRAAWITYATGTALFILALALLGGMTRRIVARPIELLAAATARVSSGQLDAAPLDLPDGEIAQLGRAFGTMTGALRHLVQGIEHTARGVGHAVDAIDRRSGDMLRGSRQHARSLEAISDAIESLDRSSGAVDRNVAGLKVAAREAASTARGLSQSLSGLHPEVHAVDTFVRQTDDAMQKMASSAASINQRILAMAGAIDRTATTFVGFDAAIRSVSDSVASATLLSDSVITTATDGQAAVEESVRGMGQIAEAFAALQAAVGRLDDSIEMIARIIAVIGTVSDQTKLLSLNASILAAQAGEHGKSFAVVADEIKGLSERTMAATHDIQRIIGTVDDERQKTRDAMDLGMRSVEHGSILSQQAGSSIASILQLTKQSAERVQGIATATRSQVEGSRSIRDATTKIVSMGKEAIASTEQQTTEARRITSLTSQIVGAIGAVRTTLQQQTASGLTVADSIDHIDKLAGALTDESQAQTESRRHMLGNVEAVRRFGEQVVTEAEQVVDEVSALRSRSTELETSVAHFRLATTNEKENA